jgi:glucose-6-phosphate isomerase
VLASLGGRLNETLCIVTSKSGGTPETRNAMVLVEAAYRAAGLDFARHAVAITMPGSAMDKHAEQAKWLGRFEMFDWVGGRTSVTSAVGLLPAALQGLDIDTLLDGAARCDAATRSRDVRQNPAAMMSLGWHFATGGRGERDMVVLPYRDRLVLLGRYLQQLVMESLGKRHDRDGNVVEQGLTVYGNKGSTDQHAYVQQLRDGLNNFFVTFVRVLDAGGDDATVQPGATSGDFLHGFWLGTRAALAERGRPSMTLTLRRLDARGLGALIALFERAVGLYAALVNVNAYDQPGVEAGKKAAAAMLDLQARITAALSATPQTAEALAAAAGASDDAESVYLLLEHLEARGVARRADGTSPQSARFVRGR